MTVLQAVELGNVGWVMRNIVLPQEQRLREPRKTDRDRGQDGPPEATGQPGNQAAPARNKETAAGSVRESTDGEEEAKSSRPLAMSVDPENLLHFRAARKRTLDRRLWTFMKIHKPVFQDEGLRAFASTAEYWHGCNNNLPKWLGYGTD